MLGVAEKTERRCQLTYKLKPKSLADNRVYENEDFTKVVQGRQGVNAYLTFCYAIRYSEKYVVMRYPVEHQTTTARISTPSQIHLRPRPSSLPQCEQNLHASPNHH